MDFDYTPHAEEKLTERKLGKKLIEDTVAKPEKAIPSVFNRKIAQRQVSGKLLRVVYEEKDEVISKFYLRLAGPHSWEVIKVFVVI